MAIGSEASALEKASKSAYVRSFAACVKKKKKAMRRAVLQLVPGAHSIAATATRASLPSPGARLRNALKAHSPLQVVGAINAYCAIMAEKSGHHALYLSGSGVAAASYGCARLTEI